MGGNNGNNGNNSALNRVKYRSTVRARKRNKEFYQGYLKQHKCSYPGCRVNDYTMLEFHHRDPELKRFTIGRQWTVSIESLREEIEKCDILCANHHKKVENKIRDEAKKVKHTAKGGQLRFQF